MSEKTVLKITNDPTTLSTILQEMIDSLRSVDGKAPTREKALAVTKLQEARFWLIEDMFRNE